MNRKIKGYVLGSIAAATYGMNPLFTLPLYENGMDADSVLFFRYLFAIPIMGIMLRARGRSFRLKWKEVPALAALGCLIAVSSLTLFQSYHYIEAGVASTILFVYPILVAIIMALVYKERVTVKTAGCIILALLGIGLLYRGADGGTLSFAGVALVLVSSLSYAIYIVGINRPQLKDIATLKVTFYILLFGLSVFGVRVHLGQTLYIVDHWYLWGNLVALAVFPTAISFFCTTESIQCIGSTPTAILGALEPVTAVFFGVVVFGEALTPRLCVGIALIILAVTLIIAGGSLTTYLVRFRKLFPRLPVKR